VALLKIGKMTNVIISFGDKKIETSVEGEDWQEIIDYINDNICISPACGNCGRAVEEMGDRCERCKNL